MKNWLHMYLIGFRILLGLDWDHYFRTQRYKKLPSYVLDRLPILFHWDHYFRTQRYEKLVSYYSLQSTTKNYLFRARFKLFGVISHRENISCTKLDKTRHQSPLSFTWDCGEIIIRQLYIAGVKPRSLMRQTQIYHQHDEIKVCSCIILKLQRRQTKI